MRHSNNLFVLLEWRLGSIELLIGLSVSAIIKSSGSERSSLVLGKSLLVPVRVGCIWWEDWRYDWMIDWWAGVNFSGIIVASSKVGGKLGRNLGPKPWAKIWANWIKVKKKTRKFWRAVQEELIDWLWDQGSEWRSAAECRVLKSIYYIDWWYGWIER